MKFAANYIYLHSNRAIAEEITITFFNDPTGGPHGNVLIKSSGCWQLSVSKPNLGQLLERFVRSIRLTSNNPKIRNFAKLKFIRLGHSIFSLWVDPQNSIRLLLVRFKPLITISFQTQTVWFPLKAANLEEIKMGSSSSDHSSTNLQETIGSILPGVCVAAGWKMDRHSTDQSKLAGHITSRDTIPAKQRTVCTW